MKENIVKNIKSFTHFFLFIFFLSSFVFANGFAQDIRRQLRIPDSTKVQVITTIDKSIIVQPVAAKILILKNETPA